MKSFFRGTVVIWLITVLAALSFVDIAFAAVGFLLLLTRTLLISRDKKDFDEIERDLYGKEYQVKAKEAECESKLEARELECEERIKARELECENSIKAKLAKAEKDDKAAIEKLAKRLAELNALESEINNAKNEISLLKMETIVDSYYYSDYDSITSEECKNKLSILKIKEQDLVKSNNAFIVNPSIITKATLANNLKQIIRCFNAECDNSLLEVGYKNIDTARSKIAKSFETLNKIFETAGVSIKQELLEIKLEQLNLVYAYELKKEQEREQQKAIREQMVEEEKVRREIEREKIKIEKEEAQFRGEITKLMGYLHKTDNAVEKNIYLDKIGELEERLRLLEIDKHNVFEREQNTRAGFVYIISNIGSFGEDIYKIGMTRRLEPMDRVKELGDASVPFQFDVHAMVFSPDAPTLEATLHQHFKNNQVNKINPRKEFFRVDLRDVEKVVKENHNATVEFTHLAKASEYRASVGRVV